MFVLYTDFGWHGPYLGQLKAALLAAAPGVPVLDLMHDAPAFDPRRAGYLLSAYGRYLPSECIIIAVVDPGVGSDRRALAARAGGRWYLGPDNGLLAPSLREAAEAKAWELPVPEGASASFHGRDLFAPAAAALYRDASPRGAPLAGGWIGADWPHELAEVLYVDGYGNAVTGLRQLDDGAVIVAGSKRVKHARTFSQVPQGSPFWYRNSSGLVELAVNQGRADALLGLVIGSAVTQDRGES